ncbi:hypothetical protein MKX03_026934 [Papaver bracteatum]|nr:hypothetical protein MKX03_026934 [Papaver bracteatum]
MGRFGLGLFLNALITHEITFAPIVPPIILELVKNPVVKEFDLTKLKLRAVMTATAPLAPELLSAFEAKFLDVQVQESYGLTEHSHETAKKNSVGFILPNLEIKFINPSGKSLPKNTNGEVCVRSDCVMMGYFKNKEETERAIDAKGWLHTCDIGYIDDDGDVFIVDRIKEMIKVKGFQVIAPAELEAILLSHPSIEDAAVVPLADEEAGEIPVACVVMSQNSTETEADVMDYVASNVATYKRVRALHFVDSIPKSPSGKIMRRFLKEELEKKINRSTQFRSSPIDI